MAGISKEELKKHLFVCILCGGGGKRLWPRSRKQTPKQFIDLFGDSTVFEQTVSRAKKLTTTDKIYIVTSYDYIDNVLNQGKDLLLRNIVAEPMAKNTALAMAMGAVNIFAKDPEAVIINLTSDHAVSPRNIFEQDMYLAAKTAYDSQQIVTVGIKPTFPHTGFGYIKVGKKEMLAGKKAVYRVLAFTEKPDYHKAQIFLNSGNYYWNTSLYTWKASVIIKTIKRFAPELAKLVERFQQAMGKASEAAIVRRIYKDAEDISIDYAVSERADNLVLLPASFSWDDIGDWDVVYQRSGKDSDGNAIIKYGKKGGYVVFESKNNLIHFNDHLLALVGVNNLIVVDTEDALLICHRKEAEKVKKIVNKLKEARRLEYL
ncbi:MAG TPA: sugar phosphate nucleotidyltransferase [Candidatus Bathyarchaeia archaeon]|nr:sugar phosphate nucleotidyltransferase [Candidatus Bathyarchaeia archaeon]